MVAYLTFVSPQVGQLTRYCVFTQMVAYLTFVSPQVGQEGECGEDEPLQVDPELVCHVPRPVPLKGRQGEDAGVVNQSLQSTFSCINAVHDIFKMALTI